MSRRKKEKKRRPRQPRGAKGATDTKSGSVAEPAAKVRRVDMPKPRNPATARQLETARQMGLSVSPEAAADLIEKRIEEFNRVLAYVNDVWQVLTGTSPQASGLAEEQMHRFIGRLLGDGHLASRVEAVQRQREQRPGEPPKRTKEFRRVASLLRTEFAQFMPKRGLLGRWTGMLLRGSG